MNTQTNTINRLFQTQNHFLEKRLIFTVERSPSSDIANVVKGFEQQVEKDASASVDGQLDKIKIGEEIIDLKQKDKGVDATKYGLAIQKIDETAADTIISIFEKAYPGKLDSGSLSPKETQRAVQFMEGVRMTAPDPVPVAAETGKISPESVQKYFNAFLEVFKNYNTARVSTEDNARRMLDQSDNIKNDKVPDAVKIYMEAQNMNLTLAEKGPCYLRYESSISGKPVVIKYDTGIKDLRPIPEGGFILLDGDGDVSKFDEKGVSYVAVGTNRVVTDGEYKTARFEGGKRRTETTGTDAADGTPSSTKDGKFTGDKVFDGKDAWGKGDKQARIDNAKLTDSLKMNDGMQMKAKIDAILNILKSEKTQTDVGKDYTSLFGQELKTESAKEAARGIARKELQKIVKNTDNFKDFPDPAVNLKEMNIFSDMEMKDVWSYFSKEKMGRNNYQENEILKQLTISDFQIGIDGDSEKGISISVSGSLPNITPEQEKGRLVKITFTKEKAELTHKDGVIIKDTYEHFGDGTVDVRVMTSLRAPGDKSVPSPKPLTPSASGQETASPSPNVVSTTPRKGTGAPHLGMDPLA